MKHEVTSMYTKKALSESLKRFMQTKPFSKITVSEIIGDCGLNRKTFYYHFADTRDLLKWTFEQEAIEVVKGFDLLIDYKDAILFTMDYLEQNQHMLNCVYDSVGRDELKIFLYNDFFEIGNMIVSSAEKAVGKHLPEEYKRIVVTFYTEGIAGIIIEWMKGEIKYNKATTVEYISSLFKNGLPAIINNV
ncbi:MAG: TetR/AcrR family transcriptional regulator C-terminal domain-containing protein [Oscillospiraceae bacterium]|nr:TetR/AcrR family transcriptional regulator C-terminal domain-containing protein [Oscillospiraceae bacterium]